jgi:NAD(P)-dependent dehydrogenase (short-subunit alcohol dehydrogenase family)
MESVKGKNILITGATGGIGAQAAKMLAASGANIFISGRNDLKLKEVADSLQIPAERVLVADLGDPLSVQSMANHIHGLVSALDILVNAAGIGIIKPMETLTLEDF